MLHQSLEQTRKHQVCWLELLCRFFERLEDSSSPLHALARWMGVFDFGRKLASEEREQTVQATAGPGGSRHMKAEGHGQGALAGIAVWWAGATAGLHCFRGLRE
jgi:hypothetical protein